MSKLALCLFMSLAYMEVSGRVQHRHKKQNNVEETWACLVASDSLGELLSKAEEILTISSDLPPFREIIYRLTDWDLMNQDERDEFVCRLDDLQYLYDLDVALYDLGIDYQVTRIYYTTTSVIVDVLKSRILEEHASIAPHHEIVNLINHLYEFSFTKMDEVGQRELRPLLYIVFPGIAGMSENIIEMPEPAPSSLTTIDKCFLLVDDLLELKDENQVSTEALYDEIDEYTGIDLDNDDVLQDLVCEAAYALNHTDLYVIHRALLNREVFLHLLKKMYPEVVNKLEEIAEMQLPTQGFKQRAHRRRSMLVGGVTENEAAQLLVYVKQFINDLRPMGLLDLEDDIEV